MCGKYFSDEAGKNEITLASTVIAATGSDSNTTSPQTGNNSTMALWICLLFVYGGVLEHLDLLKSAENKAKNNLI